ncbi:hypothetical protein BDV96DRAFT_649060 [Lophiotrema nucula]|uniref:FAD-binding FR-type domain-containing protein n=1 Tax=Lophiotrema nucula TaxID=690887 RepID=A0A6A5YZK1_9PLEO|nr:hypothetical protein BDV96DRAFT_649060 [Lophiotrema nucula]
MGSDIDELDEARHQHHLRHRTESDKRLALLFWLVIASVIAAKVVQRLLQRRSRRRCHRSSRTLTWTTIRSSLSRLIAFYKATFLFCVPRRFSIIAVSFSAGQLVLLIAYICAIGLCIVSVDAPRFSAHFVDDVAFRAAWITLTQIPFVYLLATKRGPLNLLVGVSYERINWIHRWVGRTLFLSATTHMFIMMSSISVSDVLNSPNKIMIIVRYGMGAYGTLLWISLTTILPLRRWSYRVFYLNHCLSTPVFLWVIFKHVPRYARLPLYMSATILVFDRCYSFYVFWKNNIVIYSGKRRFRSARGRRTNKPSVGFAVKLTTPTSASLTAICNDSLESTTIIRVCNVPFGWKPGQHVRLWIPRLGRLELHPFTPSNCAKITKMPFPSEAFEVESNALLPGETERPSNDLAFMIRPQRGLTHKLAQYRNEWLSSPCPNASRPAPSLTAFVDGPYGVPKAWEKYESLVLVATSTGVSFTLSIVDYLDQLRTVAPKRLNTLSIRIVWTLRHSDPDLEATVTESLTRSFALLSEAGICVSAAFYTTCMESVLEERSISTERFDPFAHLRNQSRDFFSGKPLLRLWLNEEDGEEDSDKRSTSSFQTYAESCASSTLIDDDEDGDIDSLDEPLLLDSSPAQSRWMRAITFLYTMVSRRREKPSATRSCSCRHVQTLQQQRKQPSRRHDFIDRKYGSRPDLAHFISDPNASPSEGRTMVAVCGNGSLATVTKNEVARLKLDYALGRRKHDVDIYTECFA